MVLRPATVRVHVQQVVRRPWERVQIADRIARRVDTDDAVLRVGKAAHAAEIVIIPQQLAKQFGERLLALAPHDEVEVARGQRLFDRVAEVHPAGDDDRSRRDLFGQPGEPQSLRRRDRFLPDADHVRRVAAERLLERLPAGVQRGAVQDRDLQRRKADAGRSRERAEPKRRPERTRRRVERPQIPRRPDEQNPRVISHCVIPHCPDPPHRSVVRHCTSSRRDWQLSCSHILLTASLITIPAPAHILVFQPPVTPKAESLLPEPNG